MKTLKKVLSVLLIAVFALSYLAESSLFTASADVVSEMTSVQSIEHSTDEIIDNNDKNNSLKKGQTVQVKLNTNISSFLPGAVDAIEGPFNETYGEPYVYLYSPIGGNKYFFGGWYLNPQCTGEMISTFSVVSTTQNHTLYARWYDSTETTYKVNVKANGGMWPNGVVGTTDLGIWTYSGYKTGDTFPITLPTRKGYILDGWSAYLEGTILGSSDTSYVSRNQVTVGKTNTDLVAGWYPITYKVIYDANGGTFTNTTTQATVDYDQTFYLGMGDNLNNAGYRFKGWNTKADGTGTAYEPSQSVKNLVDIDGGSITLYAQWEKVYTVILDARGVTTNPSPMQIAYGEPYTLISLNNVGDKYFAGWYRTPACDGEPIGGYTIMTEKKNHTLYARWTTTTSPKYVYAYSNGGTWNGATYLMLGPFNKGDKFTMPLPTRTGYKISSWTEQATGNINLVSGTTINGNIVTMGTRDTDIKAQWTPITYTVKYNGNGGTVKGVVTNDTFAYNETFSTLPDIVARRTGYDFINWNTKADGSGDSYGAGETVSKLTTVDGATVTLYAQWDPHTYEIIFDANAGSAIVNGATDSILCECGETVTIPASGFTRSNYISLTWNTKPDGTGTTYRPGDEVSDLSYEDNSQVTLYAQWQEACIIIFEPNGGIGSSKTVAVPTGEYILPECEFTAQPGYVFTGWRYIDPTNGMFSEVGKKVTLFGAGATHKFYAQWELFLYTIAFNANGGAGSMASIEDCKLNEFIKLPNSTFSNKGYNFTSWNTRADGTGMEFLPEEEVTELASSNGETVTLYAQWDPKPFTIGLIDEDFEPIYITDYTDDEYTFSDNTFSKIGYRISAWNTIDDKFSYEPGDTVEDLLATADGDIVTYYPIWSPINFTVRYNSNGGSGTMSNQEFTYNEPQALTLNAFTRTGYSFAGWSTSNISTTAIYTDGQTVSNLSTVHDAIYVLYAVWNANTYTLTIDPNLGIWKGSHSIATFDLIYGETMEISDPIREGYSFAGWTVSNTSSSINDSVFKMGSSDTTLTAEWESPRYVVTFNANGHGTPSVAKKEVTYGDAYGELATISEDGYAFMGWYLDKDCTGSPITADTIVKIEDNHTLYAKWILVSTNTDSDGGHSIVLNANEGVFLINGYGHINEYMLYGKKGETIVLPLPTREGYTFIGWNTMIDGSGVMIDSNVINSMPDTNLTLYAIWANNGPVLNLKYGDANCDGDINMEDVVVMQKIIARLVKYDDFGKASFGNSDITFDEKVTMEDVVLLQKFIAKLVKDLGPKVQK